MDSIEGFILAGGASSRMGTDKALLLLEGQTFIERIAVELIAAVGSATIVGSYPARRVESGHPVGRILPVVADIFGQWGALGGLHAALSTARADWSLVVACDLPFVTRELFLYLAGRRGNYEAVAPVQDDGRRQPLCAIYSTVACRAIAEKLIDAGERRPVSLLQSGRTDWVPFKDLAELDGADRFFENVNTPADYARAQRKGGSVLAL